MMKRNIYRTGASVLVTLCAALVSGWLTAIPNHRFGAGDFSMIVMVQVLPAVFLLHGILSGILLRRGLPRSVYLLVLPASFLALWLGTWGEAGASLADFFLSSIAQTVLYGVISLIGVLLYCGGAAIGKRILCACTCPPGARKTDKNK